MTLKHLLRFEICAREIREEFLYKHLETIELRQKLVYFLGNLQTPGQITRQLLRLRKRNFQGIVFI